MATAEPEGQINPMDSIFHEKQEGSLCAQHCLNALLQGHYFTAVDLAEIGRELDMMERRQMAVAGENSEEYIKFLQQPSSNYDDSGFFSIQVIQKAVEVWNLELVPYTSSCELAQIARSDPRSQYAYICNFREHWFAIRRLGNQWFNLNSLLSYPELVSDTFLSLLLTQLQQEGYSIFIARGDLPDCDGEQLLRIIPAVQKVKPRLLSESKQKSPTSQSSGSGQFIDDDLKRALAESKRLVEENDESLKKALALSMENMPADFVFNMPEMVEVAGPSTSTLNNSTSQNPSTPTIEPTAEELRQKRLAFFNKEPENDPKPDTKQGKVSEMSEEDMLKMAMDMSMTSESS